MGVDAVLRRARKRPDASPIAARTARSLGNRWAEIDPAELVEATLVSGTLLLNDFDEGLAILSEAEERAALTVSGKAYSALVRLAQAEERQADALALLARARANGVDRTDGVRRSRRTPRWRHPSPPSSLATSASPPLPPIPPPPSPPTRT